MGDSATVRMRRLLAILHRLVPDERIGLAALAEEFDVSVDSITRDLETLSMCGVAPYDPGALVPLIVEDGHLEVFGELPALKRSVRLNSEEARALAAAMQTAGFGPSDPLLSRLLRAASSCVEPDDIAGAVRAAVSPASVVYSTLAHAARDRRAVHITYLARSAQSPTERLIEPLALVCDKGTWYVESYCRKADALRTFRIDRILSAELTDEHFAEREFTSAGCALPASGLPVARLRFALADDADERVWPGLRVIDSVGDGVVAEVPFAGTEWIARMVAARLGTVEVLGPPQVRLAVAEVTREIRTEIG